MREIAFIKQNKEKWQQFENAIENKKDANPDELANLYLQLLNDLAFARTYYKKSKLVIYLNALTVKVYQKIYRTKREESNRIAHFFTIEIPSILLHHRRHLIYAFICFIVSVVIGVISAKNDDTFVRLILGNDYVNNTLENIQNGNPTAIYGASSNWASFIGITLNNLKVGLYGYVMGCTAGVGTGYVLLNNGIMLGAFQYFFAQEGVFLQSLKGIWIHGAMEIFAIVIEGAAGFILGASIIFPGTLARLESFKQGVRKSLKIVVSTFPFTIAAGFLEGFVSRYGNDMNDFLAGAIIIGTLSLISYYYLVYPFILERKIKSNINKEIAKL